MSTVLPLPPPTAATPPPSGSIPSVGIGYVIALALAFLVLLSVLLLASYLCRRRWQHRDLQRATAANASSSDGGGVMIPSVIFVPEVGNPDRPDSPTGVVGLDECVIRSYPRFKFFKASRDSDSDSTVCSICLCEYREGEMLRMMPDCRHAFHVLCIDAWLRLNGSCPVCRCSPLPTPLSTPLAEVIPLAQYADNRRRRPS